MICIKIVTPFQVPQPKATKICIIPLDAALTPSPSPPVNLFKSDPIRLDKFKKKNSQRYAEKEGHHWQKRSA